MSQDPNQPPTGYGSDPHNPYGAPPQNPYDASPQGPYSAPQQQQQQSAYGPPPQGAYGPPPQGAYGPPPQNPYGSTPQPGPYGVPPQNPYGQQAQAGYGAPITGYAFNTPVGPQVPLQPLPLGDAVQQLPNQYINVLTHPSVETFATEIPKAGWDITWIQLLILAVGSAVIGLISALFASTLASPMMGSQMGALYSTILATTSIGGAFLRIITVPIFFFIGTGIQYLLAKMFKGQGTFLTQSYTSLLYQAPISLLYYLVTLVFGLIPIAGTFIALLINFALGIYSIVLNVFQLRASHRLSTGQAVAVVLIPIAVLIVVAFLCIGFFAAIFFQMMHSGATSPTY